MENVYLQTLHFNHYLKLRQ